MTNQKLPTNADYLDSVINLYIQLPDTPVKPSQNDRRTAASFLAQRIPIPTIQAALLLASVRRLARPDDAQPLPKVQSLAYFAPVVRELSLTTLPDGYIEYLKSKLQKLAPA
jgi:hypothetical protein